MSRPRKHRSWVWETNVRTIALAVAVILMLLTNHLRGLL